MLGQVRIMGQVIIIQTKWPTSLNFLFSILPLQLSPKKFLEQCEEVDPGFLDSFLVENEASLNRWL